MNKTALIVRHVPYEGIAGFRDPVEAAGYDITRIDVCDPAFADADLVSPDLVILMGGPMGVYERAAYPWIAHELERLAQRFAADGPTLGVCLGAQMMAAALGADVYPGDGHEIGFHPIAVTAAGAQTPLAHLDGVEVLHWHGDTFDLPAGTEWLARSSRYPHQAFRRGDALLALQFHAEMGIDPRIDAWIDQSHDSLGTLGLCPQALRGEYDARGPAVVRAGQAMIGEWLGRLH